MGGGTLFEALQSISDHRTKKGTRFPLAAILAIAIAAMLSGANDLYQRPKVLTRQGGLPSAPLCESMLSALIRGGGRWRVLRLLEWI